MRWAAFEHTSLVIGQYFVKNIKPKSWLKRKMLSLTLKWLQSDTADAFGWEWAAVFASIIEPLQLKHLGDRVIEQLVCKPVRNT